MRRPARRSGCRAGWWPRRRRAWAGWPGWPERGDRSRRGPLAGGDDGRRRGGGGEPGLADQLVAELLLHGRVLVEVGEGLVAALAELGALVGVPGAGLLLDDLDLALAADGLVAALDRLLAADVEADRAVELEGVAAGGGLGVAVDHTDLLPQLIA